MRKQKKLDKGKRNAQHHQKRPAPEQHVTPNKCQKVQEPVKAPIKKIEPPKKETPKGKSSAEAMQRLSKSNPGLYKLLKADNLIQGGNDEDDVNDEFADDDRDIAYWEKKLGMNKKKVKTLGKEFEEDGLLEVLGGIEGEEGDDDQEYLRKKRQRRAEQKRLNEMEGKAEEAVDDIFAGLDSEEEVDEEDDEDMEGLLDQEDSNEESMGEDKSEDDDDAEVIDEDDIDSDEEALNEESESEQEEVEEQPKTNVLSKYVPPHLRKTAVTKSEQQMKLHKQLQGQLNRLSESNMESILLEIEKCYGIYPRHGKKD